MVLAGGIGSRFWPVSTPERPKQLLPLASDRPLIVDTVERARVLVADERIRILAGDHLVRPFRTVLSDLPDERVAELLAGHPRDAKVQLARSMVTEFHGAEAAEQAVAEFDRMFKEGGLPDEIPDVEIPRDLVRDGAVLLAAALASAGLCGSNSDGRRLIQGGGVKVDGKQVSDQKRVLTAGRYLVQSGKRKAARIVVPGS